MVKLKSEPERETISELEASFASLEGEIDKRILLASIRAAFPGMKTAQVLEWIPEQGEDIYVVLVDKSQVAEFEISRLEGGLASAGNILAVNEYRRNLSRRRRMKLDLAMSFVEGGEGGAE